MFLLYKVSANVEIFLPSNVYQIHFKWLGHPFTSKYIVAVKNKIGMFFPQETLTPPLEPLPSNPFSLNGLFNFVSVTYFDILGYCI